MAVTLNNISNLADLCKISGIKIPMLQRDYVQGRIHSTSQYEKKGDEHSVLMLAKYKEEKEKRDAFVRKLVKALMNPSSDAIQLTFIYGVTEESSNQDSSLHHQQSFVPLDGQQRLTTLFLLAWTLINKIAPIDYFFMEKSKDYQDIIKGLQTFSYMTRPSSDAFCTCLTSEKLIRVDSNKVSDRIKAQSWFDDEWHLDPSVSAMLQMLDAMDEIIDSELQGYSMIQRSQEIIRMLRNITEGKGISFELLDMNQYKLSDSLYIKMNARGKQLSNFENWKSEFIDLLKDKHPNILYNNISNNELNTVFNGQMPTLSEYFTYSIEHQWTDVFWKYCVEMIENEGMEYPVIDEYFMRFFNMIHQILFFINHKDKKEANDFNPSSKALRKETFEQEDNVKLLFDFLNIAVNISNKNWFDSIFYVSESNPQKVNSDDRVRLFDGMNTNLFDRCVKNENFTADVQSLLFALLCYVREFSTTVDADLKSFVRSIRNALESKYYVGTKPVNLVHDYNINDINSKGIISLIDSLINKKKQNNLLRVIPEHATIDDFDFTNGNLKGGFLPTSNNQTLSYTMSDVLEVFIAWDKLQDFEKSSLLLLYGFTGKRILTCALGETYFFGCSDANRWRLIFSTDDSTIKTPWQNILNDYLTKRNNILNGTSLLQNMIASKKSTIQTFGFVYYAVNYPIFLGNTNGSGAYLAIQGHLDDMNAESIRYSNRPATGYHTEPMASAVKEKLQSLSPQTPSTTLYLTSFNRGGDNGYLSIYDTKTWDGKEPIAYLEQDYGTHGNGGWILTYNGQTINIQDNMSKDRVDAGVDIIKQYFPNTIFQNKGN